MSPISTFQINFKKFTKRPIKAAFLIIPIAAVVALGMIVTSQVGNFKNAMDQSIFGTIAQQSTVFQVTRQQQRNQAGSRDTTGFVNQTNTFTDTDVATIKGISNVQDASINYTLPISQAVTTDLFSDKTVDINNSLTVLNQSAASLYTTKDFSYKEGQPVPIILNANSLIENYEDWGGKTSISVQPNFGRTPGQAPTANQAEATNFRDQLPIKSRAIDFNKDDLIGKNFTLKFGGFSKIQDYDTALSGGNITFTQRSSDDVKTEDQTRQDAINKYWNYDQLSKTQDYQFVVVGVIQSNSDRFTYVPENFAQKVMHDGINNQVTSLKSDVPVDQLNSTYTGLTYNGLTLQDPSNSGRRGGFGGAGAGINLPRQNGAPGTAATTSTTSTSYQIPGLVIQVSDSDSSTVQGIDKDLDVFTNSNKSGDTVDIKINSVVNRTQVVKDLNSKGFAYQDANDYSVFETIQSNLATISFGAIIGFAILSALIIMFNMSKSVSESTKEIGIYRALGFTKSNILQIFTIQGTLYTLLGYIIGVLLGLAGSYIVSGIIAAWFNQLLGDTVKKTFNVTLAVSGDAFQHIDWKSLTELSGILLVVTLFISVIFAWRAASVSPVEAIKAE